MADKHFYTESTDWAYDLYHSQSLWLRRALLGLVVLSVLLIISLSTNLILLPLKEKVPYLYAFDHATGEITKVGKLQSSQFENNWTLTRFLLIHYVINRESYDADNIDVPYQQVWAQSGENVKAEYEELVNSDNKKSPYQLYGKDKYLTVHVNAINRLNAETVDVKFTKTLHDRAANTTQAIQKEAIIKWKYTKAEITQKMLDRDPLGFKVTYYQVTQVNLNKELGE